MLRSRTTWVRALLLMLALALPVYYGAFAQARRGGAQHPNDNSASVSLGAQFSNPAFQRDMENDPATQRYRTWLHSSKVSSDAFARALRAAHALPPSPLLHAERFVPAGWTFGQLSPIDNAYGHGGGSICLLPFPTPSACGASARIAAIAVDPRTGSNGDIVYVGSEGGLAKSTNGGQNWTYLSDLPFNSFLSQSIRCIAIDPVAPDIVYVGTGTTEFFGQGIYRSTNAGASWKQLGSTEFGKKRVLKIVIDPATAGSATSTTLYASVVKGAPNNDPNHCGDSPGNCTHTVWRSTDSGLHWATIRSVPGPADVDGWTYYDLATQQNADTASTLYVTTPDITNGNIPAANPPGAVYKVIGSTWTKIRSFPDAFVPSFLALTKSGGQPVLYLGYSDSGNRPVVERSTDRGSSWTTLPEPGVGALYALDVDLADRPVNQHIIVAGVSFPDSRNLGYSTDGGSTWQSAAHYAGPPCYDRCEVHPDVHSFAFCPTNSLRNYVGTDGGVYRADDIGGSDPYLTWWSKNENLPGALMNGVSLSADGSMVMGNTDNGTQLYAAPTPNPPWVFVAGPGPGDGYKPKIDQISSNKYYYPSYTYGATACCVNRVIDGGWNDITPPGARGEASAGYPALFVSPSDARRVVVGFQNVYRSTDSGGNWTRIGPSPTPTPPGGGTVFALYESPTNSDVIFAIMDRHRVILTTNAGAATASWTLLQNLPADLSNINAVTVDPTAQCTPSPSPAHCTAYLAYDHAVYKTTDMGSSWSTPPPSLPLDAIYTDVAIDPANNQHVFAASYAGVFSSTDGGATWSNMSAGIPAGMAVTSLSLNNTSRKLAVSTYGRGAYILDLNP